MLNTNHYRIDPKSFEHLRNIPTRYEGEIEKDDAKEKFALLTQRLCELQTVMFAQGKHHLLIVLQAMDAAGKDSTIRHVFSPINPQGCIVTGFGKPTEAELARDYLWRIHHAIPPAGKIGIFNRSHYESLLIERVQNIVPEQVWSKRYQHINDFERRLADEGLTILKFMLHISKDYQKQQFEDRLNTPHKQWKFNPADLAERERWDDYQDAFSDALRKCSTDHAPWYVVPAERKWFRNLLVAQTVVDKLESLQMSFPEIDYNPKDYKIT